MVLLILLLIFLKKKRLLFIMLKYFKCLIDLRDKKNPPTRGVEPRSRG